MSTPPYLRWPPGSERLDLPTGRGPLRAVALDAAAGAPRRDPVVLLPGFTGSKEDFIALLGPVAAAGHSVLAYDQRGQYESPGPDDPAAYDLPALAADLRAVAAWAVDRWGGAPHVVGHSFGGLVARAAALDLDLDRDAGGDHAGAPGPAPASLTLMSSGPAALADPQRRLLQLLHDALPTTDLPTIWAIKRAMELEDGRSPRASDEVERFLQHRFCANATAGLRRLVEHLLGEPDRTAELAATGIPVLVVYGTGDDVWPPATQQEMARRLRAHHVALPDAGHSPAVDDPEATAAALITFWRDAR